MKIKKIVYVIPAYNSVVRLGEARFHNTVVRTRNIVLAQNPENIVLVVNNSSTQSNSLAVLSAARRPGATAISVPQIGPAYARFRGIDHAFQRLGADLAIMGDDDLHVKPSAIPALSRAIVNGADLAIGVRSCGNLLSHPLWQFGLESALNFYASYRLDIWPAKLSLFSFGTDFISGGMAFGREGWENFRRYVNEETMKKLGTACTFFPGVYKRLGLKIDTVRVDGPYEGNYWQDTFNPEQFRKRVRTIKSDFHDAKAALELPLPGKDGLGL
ncbi:MAG: glycosyltransferase [Candidatus Margulisiibacteriota bacterium]|jgi:hypothetical protein